MLKKINVHDARLGMFVQEVCGRWIDHPFWKRSFLLQSPKLLHTLQTCGIQEVWIDTKKGRDVEARQTVLPPVQLIPEPAEPKEQHVLLHDELPRAEKLQENAKRTVARVFNDARMGNALRVAEVIELVEDVTQSVTRNADALLNIVRIKGENDYTYLHSVAVSALMIALGKQMGMPNDILRKLGLAGMLHDVGNILVPQEILGKPGKLSAGEFEIVKRHSRQGWEILSTSGDMDEIVLEVCLHHHERIDGSGYPDGLAGEDVSLYVRMAAVCDVYDALTSDSCYRKALPPADAIHKMAEMQDGQFDVDVFHALVKTVGIFPVGTLVKLKSGRLAVVIDQSSKSLTMPVVKVFFSSKANEPIFPELVDLSKGQDSIVSVEDPAKWKLDVKTMAGV